MSTRTAAKGFSLIELMVAVALGLLLIGAVGNVFLATSRGYKEDDKISKMQDNLRFAMAQLVSDIEMAGFFAQAGNPDVDVDIFSNVDAVFPNSGADQCTRTWVFGDRRPFDTLGNATVADAKAKFPCITASAGFQAGTDVLAIKRVRGTCTAAPTANWYYLRTNGYESLLYRHPAGALPAGLPGGAACPDTPTGTTVDIYQYDPAIWFIGLENNVPSLCRLGLEDGVNLRNRCIAEGIEDLQVEVGMDTSNDGVTDYFTSFNTEPNNAARSRMVALRVHLLARAAELDRNYRNQKSYTLGNRVHPATNDGYYRKTLSSIVLMRNSANRISPYALPE